MNSRRYNRTVWSKILDPVTKLKVALNSSKFGAELVISLKLSNQSLYYLKLFQRKFDARSLR